MEYASKKSLTIEINKNNTVSIDVSFGELTHIVDVKINNECVGSLYKPNYDLCGKYKTNEDLTKEVSFLSLKDLFQELHKVNSEDLFRTTFEKSNDSKELIDIYTKYNKKILKLVKLQAFNSANKKQDFIMISNWF